MRLVKDKLVCNLNNEDSNFLYLKTFKEVLNHELELEKNRRAFVFNQQALIKPEITHNKLQYINYITKMNTKLFKTAS